MPLYKTSNYVFMDFVKVAFQLSWSGLVHSLLEVPARSSIIGKLCTRPFFPKELLLSLWLLLGLGVVGAKLARKGLPAVSWHWQALPNAVVAVVAAVLN